MRSRSLLFAVAVLFVTAQSLHAQEPSAQEEAAVAAADAWIDLVDSSSYGESWEAAAPEFQSGISQDDWAAAVQQVHGQVGKIQSRELLQSQYRTSLPNAPEGEYVVIQYQSVFSGLPQAMEMIVMSKSNGEWKAAGYQVMPPQQQNGPNQ